MSVVNSNNKTFSKNCDLDHKVQIYNVPLIAASILLCSLLGRSTNFKKKRIIDYQERF